MVRRENGGEKVGHGSGGIVQLLLFVGALGHGSEFHSVAKVHRDLPRDLAHVAHDCAQAHRAVRVMLAVMPSGTANLSSFRPADGVLPVGGGVDGKACAPNLRNAVGVTACRSTRAPVSISGVPECDRRYGRARLRDGDGGNVSRLSVSICPAISQARPPPS